MNWKKTLSVTIVAMTLFVAAGAAAKREDSGNMFLGYDATLAGAHLASGKYQVKWQTHTPAATVSVLQGNKVVATAEGRVVDRGRKYDSNEVVYEETSNGARVIRELRFQGSSQVIVFD